MTGRRKKFWDLLYAVLLCVAVAALAWAWEFKDPPADLAEKLAVAAGLRPADGTLSLHWQLIAGSLCSHFGLETTFAILRIAGHLALGAVLVLVTVLFGWTLPKTFRRGEHLASWWRFSVRFIIFQGAALFCLSYPVWDEFRWFSPVALQVLLSAVAALLCIRHIRTNSRRSLYASFVLLGLIAADTPVGVILLAMAVVGVMVRNKLQSSGFMLLPNENPLAAVSVRSRASLAFFSGALAGTVLESAAFISLDGLTAFGWTAAEYACKFPLVYIKSFLAMCSPAGTIFFTAVVVLPILIELKLLVKVTDDEKLLSYFHGMTFLVCGIVAFSQFAGMKGLWFWTWTGGAGCVRDSFLKCVAMCLCSLSAMWSLAVFAFELRLRNIRRVTMLRFQDAVEEDGAKEALETMKRVRRAVRTILLVEPFIVFAGIVPYRAQSLEREMLEIVSDAARETVEECDGATYIFTDGGLDAIVELDAALAGRRLYALSLMGGAADAREIYLRTRGAVDDEDRALLESGAADALRTWVRSRPDKASDYAVQIGFEVWRRDGRPMPKCSGMVARPAGLDPEASARGAAAGRKLAERVLAVYDKGNPDAIADRVLRDAFLFAQWRLAVIARHRANAYDGRGLSDLAMEETRLADALDRKNGAIARIRATMAWASKRKLERMTPQEGLRLGLARADFALARMFALRVLDVSPDDPAANFALGMDFFVQRQYVRAQAYLERCLEGRPDDPAVLNNLAQCHLRRGDAEGALPYAQRALEILPDSPEVNLTMERIKAALRR